MPPSRPGFCPPSTCNVGPRGTRTADECLSRVAALFWFISVLGLDCWRACPAAFTFFLRGSLAWDLGGEKHIRIRFKLALWKAVTVLVLHIVCLRCPATHGPFYASTSSPFRSSFLPSHTGPFFRSAPDLLQPPISQRHNIFLFPLQLYKI